MAIDQYLVTRTLNRLPAGGAALLEGGTTRPGLRARAAAHAAFKAAQQHLANLDALRTLIDPEMAPELLPELRQEVARTLNSRTDAQFTNPFDGLVTVAQRAAAAAEQVAAKHRPVLDPESTTQMIRTDQAWNNSIRPALEAGKGWDEIIPTLDTDGILAVERFAPGHESRIRDRFHQNEVPAVLAGIQDATARRVVDIAPSEGREALREAQDAAQSLEYVRSVAGWAGGATEREAASVSIGLTRGAFEVGAQLPVDTSPEAQAAYSHSLTEGAA